MSESDKEPRAAGEEPEAEGPSGRGSSEPLLRAGSTDTSAEADDGDAPSGRGSSEPLLRAGSDAAAGEAALAALEAEMAGDDPSGRGSSEPLLRAGSDDGGDKAERSEDGAKAVDAAPSGPGAAARFFGFFRLGLREAPGMVASKVIGLLCLFFVVLVWYWATAADIPEERLISPSVLPSPYEVVTGFDTLMDRGLVAGIAATLKRVFIGFGLAIAFGVSAGIMAASFRPLQAFLAPIVLFGRSLPLAALIPLTLVWFGIEDKQKIMFIFIATVPFIFSDTVAAVLAIHERYVETAQTLGASKRQIIFKVLVPLSLPDIFTSVRFLFGLSFGYIMLAEVINAKAGIGYLINQSFSRGAKMDHAILLLIIVGLLAYVIDRLLVFFQRGLFPYRSDL